MISHGLNQRIGSAIAFGLNSSTSSTVSDDIVVQASLIEILALPFAAETTLFLPETRAFQRALTGYHPPGSAPAPPTYTGTEPQPDPPRLARAEASRAAEPVAGTRRAQHVVTGLAPQADPPKEFVDIETTHYPPGPRGTVRVITGIAPQSDPPKEFSDKASGSEGDGVD